jgi:ferric-dicitrate binding protein FerR (iron transport regulator)
MKNKAYYIDLSERWFDALLTEDEERALKAFLASTDDPDFDEIKAVAGFFATGKAVYGAQEENHRPARQRRTTHQLAWAAIAVAASLALVAAIGLYNQRQNQCYILAYGEKSTDKELALESMEATLSSLFGTAPDIEKELETLLK